MQLKNNTWYEKKILISGAGGFIAGYLVKDFLSDGHEIICVDSKPFENWFQYFKDCENYSLDLRDYQNSLKISKKVDYIFNLACNMGGMGFIENNKSECMLSVLINTNLLMASVKNSIERYFFFKCMCI